MTPMDDKARAEMQAQYRFLVINLCRITGAVLLVVGLAVIAPDVSPDLARTTIAAPHVLGALQASEAVKTALADRIT